MLKKDKAASMWDRAGMCHWRFGRVWPPDDVGASPLCDVDVEVFEVVICVYQI